MGAYVQVPLALLRSADLSIGAAVTFGLLRFYAGDRGCFPSEKTLAGDLQVTERQVRTYIRALEKRGDIKIIQRGRGKPNHYELVGDRKKTSGHEQGDRKETSGPDRKKTSGQIRKKTSAYQYAEQKTASRYPLTADAVDHFFKVNDTFIGDLVKAAQAVKPDITDEELGQAIYATHRNGRQRKPGLWFKTVPEFLKTGASGQPRTPAEQMMREAERQGRVRE